MERELIEEKSREIKRNGRERALQYVLYSFSRQGENHLSEAEIQKTGYLLQSLGIVPFQYTMNGYDRGPISSEIEEDLFRLKEMGKIEREGDEYRVKEGKIECDPIGIVKKEDFKKMIETISETNEIELSLISKFLELSKIHTDPRYENIFPYS